MTRRFWGNARSSTLLILTVCFGVMFTVAGFAAPPPSFSISSSSASSILGQNVTFTVANGAANGSVDFFDGSLAIGFAKLDGSGGGSFSSANLSVGSHTISATDSKSAQASVQVTVAPRSATASVSLSTSSVVVGETSTVTATITDQASTGPATISNGPGSFILTSNSPLAARTNAAAVLLPNGNALIFGGTVSGTATNSVELYDGSGAFSTVAANMAAARSGHTATLLPYAGGGVATVLIAGGDTNGDAELYSFDMTNGTGSSTSVSSLMQLVRSGHTATLLPDGNVLIAGGTVGGASAQSLELFVPTVTGGVVTDGTFASVSGALVDARSGHTATLLGTVSGLPAVLIAGGDSVGGTAELISVDDSGPSVQAVGQVGDWPTARTGHTATLLPDGTLLIAGGTFVAGANAGTVTNTAEIYVPPTDLTTFASFDTAASGTALSVARSGQSATLLNSALVLLVGGESNATAEIYTPAFDPRGTVNFSSNGGDSFDQSTNPCNVIPGGTGSSSCQTTVTAGPITSGNSRNSTIKAQFSAVDADHVVTGSSSPTATLTVTKANTQTTISSNSTFDSGTSTYSSTYGDPVTFTATVKKTSNNTNVNSGKVQFQADGSDLGLPASVSNGTATLITTALAAGSHSITANYSGSTSSSDSTSPPLTQNVAAVNTTTTVTASPNPAVYGQPVVITVTVQNANSSTVDPGTVNLTIASVTTPLTMSNGVATFAFADPSDVRRNVGSYDISAAYGGDANENGSSSSTITEAVNALPVTITPGPQSKTFGVAIGLGTTAFSTPALPYGEQVTSVTLAALVGTGACDSVGSYDITMSAPQIADPNNYVFTSGVGQLTVGPAATNTTLSSLIASVAASGQLNLIAHVNVSAPGVDPNCNAPAGTVSLTANGQTTLTPDNPSDAGTNGTVAGGIAVLSSSVLSLPQSSDATYSINAAFTSSDPNYDNNDTASGPALAEETLYANNPSNPERNVIAGTNLTLSNINISLPTGVNAVPGGCTVYNSNGGSDSSHTRCSIVPNPGGGVTSPITITVETSNGSTLTSSLISRPPFTLLGLPVAGILLFGLPSSSRRRLLRDCKLRVYMGLAIVAITLLASIGCGSGFKNDQPLSTGLGTTPGTYYVTATVNNSSTNTSVASVVVPINVQ